MIRDEIVSELYKKQDVKYRDFQAKLIPSRTAEEMIGVKTPELRKYAKELFKNGDHSAFLDDLPHFYYEENNQIFYHK